MVTIPSTSTWKRVDLPLIEHIRRSTDIRALSRTQWPSWTASSTQFNRILAFSQLAALGTTLPSTGVVAALLTERIDPSDAPKIHNYNFYLIAESSSGEYFQSPPIRSSDPAHHSSAPSTWFEGIGSPW
jgi:hypothetical protein